MDTSTRVLDAALPKLGALGHQGAENLFAVFDGLTLLVSDSRGAQRQDLTEQTRCVALHIGRVVGTLGELYKLDRPEPLKKAGINLETVGLEELKDLGL